MSDRLLLIRSCVHGHLRTHWVKEGDGIIRCPVESTVLEGTPDPDDVKAALDWFGDQWRPFLPPEEQLVGHLAWKRVKDAAVWVAAVFGGTP